MRHTGPIDVLEAAYEIDRAAEGWEHAIASAALPLMTPCLEAMGYFIETAGPTIEGIVSTGSLFQASEWAAVSIALRSTEHKLRVRNVAERLSRYNGMARRVERSGAAL